MNTEKIADRANQLSMMMPTGSACRQACIEAGVPTEDLPRVADVVAAILRTREANPRVETKIEINQRKLVSARVPHHLAAILAELEAEAARRGQGFAAGIIRALKRGQPRWQQLAEAEARARREIQEAQ